MNTSTPSSSTRRWSMSIACAASLALAVAGCSDGTKPEKPTTSAAAPTSSSSTGSSDIASTLQHPTHVFGGKDNVFTADITKAPVAKNSAGMVKTLRSQIEPNWGGVAAFNAYQYNSSLFVADASTPKVRVTYVDCQKKGWTPEDFYGGKKFFVDVPIPKDALPSTGTDAAMAIWDPTQDKFWEFWQMKKDAKGWNACFGGRIDGVSTNKRAEFPYPYGSSASGLATSATAISVKEAQELKIDHAMYLALIQVGSWDDISYPANRSDGGGQGPNRIPMGTRIRLDPTVNVDALPMSPLGKAVARAAQKHGFLVSESAGAVGVATMSGNAEKVRTGTNPWDKALGGAKDYEVLKGFPWDKVQFIEKDWGKPTG